MNFADVIKEINNDKRLKPDLLKTENGNNFRAVSESAILDVIEPIFQKYGLYYTTEIKESHLEIKEAYGKKGKKLQFIYYLVLKIIIFTADDDEWKDEICICSTESVGMGIDDCDKAAGKAYTYALKYGLLKLFRLRFGDDPDFAASEPLITVPEVVAEKPKKEPTKSKEKAASSEPLMSEKQRSYITGMMEQKGISSQQIMGKFGGLDPVEDDNIPMKTARAMIKYLEEIEDLPF